MSRRKTRRRSKQFPELDTTEETQPLRTIEQEPPNCLNFRINHKFTPTLNQKQFNKYAFDPATQIIFCEGPAGTAKTYYAAYAALEMLKEGRIGDIIYVRSIVESARKAMGSLPGEVNDKFKPWMKPLLEKCDELIGTRTTNELIKQNLIRCEPVNYLRGSTFKDCAVIVDETQNLEMSEIITIITRIGVGCKMFFLGDSIQSDIQKNCFERVKKNFSDQSCVDKGIQSITFTEEDITRSEILKFIISRIKLLK
jgi:phosphate starvation-inducible PhoH-like protein